MCHFQESPGVELRRNAEKVRYLARITQSAEFRVIFRNRGF